MIAKPEKMKPLSVHGNNQLIGFYESYAIVFDYESEQFFYFYIKNPVESLLFSCVEKELLEPISELPETMQNDIRKKFLED